MPASIILWYSSTVKRRKAVYMAKLGGGVEATRDMRCSFRLPCFYGDRHDNRCRRIGSLHELDLRDRVRALRRDRQVAYLLAAQREREFGPRHIDAADVVGEMLAVDQRMVLRLAVGVV